MGTGLGIGGTLSMSSGCSPSLISGVGGSPYSSSFRGDDVDKLICGASTVVGLGGVFS